MMRIKFSVRFGLILTACTAIAICWLGPLTHPTITYTARQLDVAIVGPGYFRVVDDSICEARFTRTGRIEIAEDRNLVIVIAENSYPIDPPIMVPRGSEQIEITADGYVRAATHAGSETIGRFQISRFGSDSPFARPWLFNSTSRRSGFEKIYSPQNGAGFLKQGHLENAPPETWSIVSVFTLALLASFLLTYAIGSLSKSVEAPALDLLDQTPAGITTNHPMHTETSGCPLVTESIARSR